MSQPAPQHSSWIISTERATFQQDVLDRSHQKPVVVDFWAPWCQPCRSLAPILEKLADEYGGQFLLVRANAEELPEAAAQFGVQSIPAVYGLRNGEIRDLFVGLLPEREIRQWIDRLLPSVAEVKTTEGQELVATDAVAAEAKYREAIALEANLAAPQIGLAQLLLQQGRLAECLEVIEHLQKRGFLEPEAEKIKAAMGLRLQGDQAGDLDACRQAAEEDPEDLQRQLRLAESLAALQEYEEALDVGLKIVIADRRGLGEDARKLMVDVFRLLPDDSDLTSTYRRKLSAALY